MLLHGHAHATRGGTVGGYLSTRVLLYIVTVVLEWVPDGTQCGFPGSIETPLLTAVQPEMSVMSSRDRGLLSRIGARSS